VEKNTDPLSFGVQSTNKIFALWVPQISHCSFKFSEKSLFSSYMKKFSFWTEMEK